MEARETLLRAPKPKPASEPIEPERCQSIRCWNFLLNHLFIMHYFAIIGEQGFYNIATTISEFHKSS